MNLLEFMKEHGYKSINIAECRLGCSDGWRSDPLPLTEGDRTLTIEDLENGKSLGDFLQTASIECSWEDYIDDNQKKSDEDISITYIKSNTEEIKALINAFDKSTKDIQGLSRLSVLDKMDVLGILAKHMKKVVDEYPVIKDLMQLD